jgi:hypothetical protein
MDWVNSGEYKAELPETEAGNSYTPASETRKVGAAAADVAHHPFCTSDRSAVMRRRRTMRLRAMTQPGSAHEEKMKEKDATRRHVAMKGRVTSPLFHRGDER